MKITEPQARILSALMPDNPQDHWTEWPELSRVDLVVAAGLSPTNSANRIINGNEQPGLLPLGLMRVGTVEHETGSENVYRITAAGIKAFLDFLAENKGQMPKRKDKAGCVNERYSGAKKAGAA